MTLLLDNLHVLSIMVNMNKLAANKRVQVISALVEGNSVRATVGMTGVTKNTVVKLLVEIGQACHAYQDKTLRNLPCRRIQCDEICSFRCAQAKNAPADKQGKFGFGDAWTWTAMCADTKLVPCWRIGGRNAWHAQHFMHDLACRLVNRVRLTTDGRRVYLQAVWGAFGEDIDYGMLVKLYSNDQAEEDVRYTSVAVTGNPKAAHISTSFVERQNFTMRMSMRRFTRLTKAFSKKVHNHCAAVSLHFMHYNFCRIHQTLRVTPAMEAKVTDHMWSIGEVVGLTDPPRIPAAVEAGWPDRIAEALSRTVSHAPSDQA